MKRITGRSNLQVVEGMYLLHVGKATIEIIVGVISAKPNIYNVRILIAS